MSFFSELRRRNVLRAGTAYVVSSWLLIQVAETIFPLFGFGDTPARFVVIILAIGFIPAMVIAWVFELTPEGLKKDADVDHALPASVQAGKRLDRLILVILALAGYLYTAGSLIMHLIETTWMIFGLILLNELAVRWLTALW